jgi:TRAP-type mannitol/chloroaromatic compound transport system substrate-binding protein
MTAPNTSPVFTLTPNTVTASGGTTPNTASDGSGTLVTLFTAGPQGSRVERITATNAQVSAAASTANVIRVFLTDTSGNNPRLIAEAALPAATRTTAVIGATVTITFLNGISLASGQLLKVCQAVYAGVQDLTHFVAYGGDF